MPLQGSKRGATHARSVLLRLLSRDNGINPGEFVVGEVKIPQGADGVVDLCRAARPDERGCDAGVSQYPRERHLGKRLPT